MAVLIDPPLWPAHGRLWSHLVSDSSLEELHAFARAAGVPERGFEGDHYDVPEDRYEQLVAAGAEPVSGRELLTRLQRSGLRRPKRRGERVVASTVAPGARRRLDTVRSALPPPGPATSVTLLVLGTGGILIDASTGGPPTLVPAGDGDDLSSAAGFGARVLGLGSTVHWWRVGHLRSAPLDGVEPAVSYESVLAAQCPPADRSTPVTPSDGYRWWPPDEELTTIRRELSPLVRAALAQAGR